MYIYMYQYTLPTIYSKVTSQQIKIDINTININAVNLVIVYPILDLVLSKPRMKNCASKQVGQNLPTSNVAEDWTLRSLWCVFDALAVILLCCGRFKGAKFRVKRGCRKMFQVHYSIWDWVAMKVTPVELCTAQSWCRGSSMHHNASCRCVYTGLKIAQLDTIIHPGGTHSARHFEVDIQGGLNLVYRGSGSNCMSIADELLQVCRIVTEEKPRTLGQSALYIWKQELNLLGAEFLILDDFCSIFGASYWRGTAQRLHGSRLLKLFKSFRCVAHLFCLCSITDVARCMTSDSRTLPQSPNFFGALVKGEAIVVRAFGDLCDEESNFRLAVASQTSVHTTPSCSPTHSANSQHNYLTVYKTKVMAFLTNTLKVLHATRHQYMTSSSGERTASGATLTLRL